MAARGKSAKGKTAAKASGRKSKVKSSDKLKAKAPPAAKTKAAKAKAGVKTAKALKAKVLKAKAPKAAKLAKAKLAKKAAAPLKAAKAAKSGAKARGAKRAARAKPIALYFWPTPNGLKISIALEELKLPYDIHPVNIMKGEQFAPDFLKISPNNRMPAIVDPDGPGGKPISIFESGAILQYLGEKTGKLYPSDWRKRVAVDEWLFWQVGGLGPMAGQAHHFLFAAPEKIPYAVDRYVNESRRLYGVMDRRLAEHEFLADKYSIADIAAYGWAIAHDRHLAPFDDLPHVKRWFDAIAARPAVKRGQVVGAELRPPPPLPTPEPEKAA